MANCLHGGTSDRANPHNPPILYQYPHLSNQLNVDVSVSAGKLDVAGVHRDLVLRLGGTWVGAGHLQDALNCVVVLTLRQSMD